MGALAGAGRCWASWRFLPAAETPRSLRWSSARPSVLAEPREAGPCPRHPLVFPRSPCEGRSPRLCPVGPDVSACELEPREGGAATPARLSQGPASFIIIF